MGCYHVNACLKCPCVKRLLDGGEPPHCLHGVAHPPICKCVIGCSHIAEAKLRSDVKERIDARECARLMAL